MVDERQDLVAEGTDVAIRSACSTIPALAREASGYCRASWWHRQPILPSCGTPKTPADLASHDCISAPDSRAAPVGRSRGTERKHRSMSAAASTDSGPGVFACVLAGLGVAITSPIMAGPEIVAGALIPLLKSYKLSPLEVYAIFPGGRRPSTKVRALVDYLATDMKRTP